MRKSRLSKQVQNRLPEHFITGATARSVSAILGINKSTAALYFHRLRQLIFESLEEEQIFSGEIELEESYFSGKRKGNRDRGGGW